ncbi:MAG: thiamine-phosphate kinase [Planctomycetota bacterium]
MPHTERELLDRIAERSGGLVLPFGRLAVGPGDDCAVVELAGETLLVTADQLVEGRHYEPGTDVDLVARKAVSRSISDIAAMGGSPIWATATGLLPDGFEHAAELFDAMKRWAEAWSSPLIGGDLATGPGPLVLTTTVVGRMAEGVAPVPRSGARPGDGVYLSGPIGGSLPSGRHLTFEPRLAEGARAAAEGGHAMIDLSDGLGIDADRVARASGVRIELEADAVPLHQDAGGWRQAIGHGEDYELLLCSSKPIEGFVGPVGRVAPGPPGAVVLDGAGAAHDAAVFGWDHGD